MFNFSAAPFSVPAFFFFQLQRLFLLLFSSGQRLFLLLFLFWSAPLSSLVLFTQCPPFLLFVFLLYSFVFSASFFFSSRRVALFFISPKIFFSNPKPFFTSAQNLFSAQNVFASAQNTFSVQPKNIIFSLKRFCFSPRYFFSSAQKSLPVCGLVPPSFCFFSAFSHYVLPFFSPSVWFKTFFSCFMSLYLSKSSFSSSLK